MCCPYDPLTKSELQQTLCKCPCCDSKFWKAQDFMTKSPMGSISMVPCSAASIICEKCDAMISSRGVADLSLDNKPVEQSKL